MWQASNFSIEVLLLSGSHVHLTNTVVTLHLAAISCVQRAYHCVS